MASSKQTMQDVKSGGKVRQISNVEIQQVMEKIEAVGDIEQLIEVVEAEIPPIAAELTRLHAELAEYDPKAIAELQRVKNAEDAAKRGDSSGVVANLRGIARWVGDFATKIGTSLVAKIIEKQLGL
jgi:hypothetical protein